MTCQTVPVPRILSMFGNLGQTIDDIENSKNKYHMCWPDVDISGIVHFLSKDIFVQITGSQFVRGLDNPFIPRNSQLWYEEDDPHFNINNMHIYDVNGYKFEQINSYTYSYPAHSTGDGQPVFGILSNVRMFPHNNKLKSNKATFYWRDKKSNVFNRSDGPHHFTMDDLVLTPNDLSWYVRSDLKEGSIYDKIKMANPFTSPFFDDPQDELAFQTEIDRDW